MENNSEKNVNYPEVVLQFTSKVSEEELQQMILGRNQLLMELGYLPPDESHEFWHKPDV